MNPRELVDYIRSGPADLVLDEPLRFRRRTRSNPCDFYEFLQALQSSETIRTILCVNHLELGISEDEWVLLIKTLGTIKDIHSLKSYCIPGSRDFHPFQAFADTVNNARSLCKLTFGADGETFPRDSSGLNALASALRDHTGLQEFNWLDRCHLLEAAQSTALDPVLRALPACPHLLLVLIMTKFARADAVRNLLHLPMDTSLRLVLVPDQWLAVADEIRQSRCRRKELQLWMVRSTHFEATEAVKAVASAIRWDHHLETLVLQMEDGFTDEAGVALAEAFTINKTLRILLLNDNVFASNSFPTKASLGARAFEAFCTMLRVNTSIRLVHPPFDVAAGDRRDLRHFDQMRIEQRLNEVGRGRLLASSQTPRELWVNALQVLNAPNEDGAFTVSCLYSLLRLNPDVCMQF